MQNVAEIGKLFSISTVDDMRQIKASLSPANKYSTHATTSEYAGDQILSRVKNETVTDNYLLK